MYENLLINYAKMCLSRSVSYCTGLREMSKMAKWLSSSMFVVGSVLTKLQWIVEMLENLIHNCWEIYTKTIRQLVLVFHEL